MARLGEDCTEALPRDQTTADAAIELLRQAAQRASGLAARAEDQLSSIMQPLRSSDSDDKCESVESDWPPLFSDVREMTRQIQTSLRRIEECLNRAGV